MRKFAFVLCVLLAVPAASAKGAGGHGGRSGGGHSTHATKSSGGGSHGVRGYTRKDGTYVAAHRQTNPNNSKRDNWSTKGNANPQTGKKGTVDPDKR